MKCSFCAAKNPKVKSVPEWRYPRRVANHIIITEDVNGHIHTHAPNDDVVAKRLAKDLINRLTILGARGGVQ